MFMGTLVGPFFNFFIGSSSSGFMEMVLTGERIESGIKSGKILMAPYSNAEKRPFGGKNKLVLSMVKGAIIKRTTINPWER